MAVSKAGSVGSELEVEFRDRVHIKPSTSKLHTGKIHPSNIGTRAL